MKSTPVHPLGTRAKILLSSVFGPYAQDDAYGSRTVNPMELYQNQVTRTQGALSLRMFHRSFGLMLLQANIDAPCTLLDFPSRERFIQEIQEQPYDVIGIGAILPNTAKVVEMCALVRRFQPRATLVIGGHIANKGDLDRIVDADHIVKGDGVQWFRKFLGQDEKAPVRHPAVLSGFGTRIMGTPLPTSPGSTAAILIPSVGCPMGCNFCSTSAMFGGKGKFVSFYETGDELFAVMQGIATELQVRSFFVLDENFLLQRKRALRLLELMEQHHKSWSLYVFSSARVLQSYSMEQLIGLGISWVWMGLEGKQSQYAKLNGVDTRALVKSLQSQGIRVLGSSIIGLEHHTPENIHAIIDDAIAHDSDFHQFMLYTPIAGTPLYAQHQSQGTLIPESQLPPADVHGQYRFNYRHPHIHDGREEQFLLDAFNRDLAVNGPSLARLIRTTLDGWLRYKKSPDQRVRERFAQRAKVLRTTYAGAVWAMSRWYRDDARIGGQMRALLARLYREFGWSTRIVAAVVGRYLYRMMKKEDLRLAQGWTYEPASFYEHNAAALALPRMLPKAIRSPLPRLGAMRENAMGRSV
ncbi:MAG: B12-binding domain-containing radical SAM protein [Desulfobacterales bacterium]|nr:B12-binding domain-containing radical SAM protein [Desulfobacterales bacterium]